MNKKEKMLNCVEVSMEIIGKITLFIFMLAFAVGAIAFGVFFFLISPLNILACFIGFVWIIIGIYAFLSFIKLILEVCLT